MMRNFVLSMVVVFMVLCVPWFCVAQADTYCYPFSEEPECVAEEETEKVEEHVETYQEMRDRKRLQAQLDDIEKQARRERYGY
jgi:hypothetical protein